jgi:tetratricopeptide (TPR) repeat protein
MEPGDLPLGEDAGLSDEHRRQALRNRSVAYERMNNHQKAETDLTTALGLKPMDPALFLERGYFYFRRARYADAIVDFLDGEKLDPNGWRYSYAAGRAKAASGEHRSAIALYDRAVRLNTHSALTMLSRAEALVHLKMLQQAKADYDRALELTLARAADRFYALLGRGYVRLMLEEYDDALVDLAAALEIDADAFSARLWHGYANERRGRSDLALNDYERAFAVAPGDRWVIASLRRLRARERRMVPPPELREMFRAKRASALLPAAHGRN